MPKSNRKTKKTTASHPIASTDNKHNKIAATPSIDAKDKKNNEQTTTNNPATKPALHSLADDMKDFSKNIDEGKKKNFETLLKRANTNKKPDDQYEVGYCYLNGEGTNTDLILAAVWFSLALNNKAEKTKSDEAKKHLIDIYDKLAEAHSNDTEGFEKTFRYLTKGADLGDKKAQRRLGYAYLTGAYPIPLQNTGKAVEWLQKAANQGDSKSCGVLGDLYYQGKHLQRNPRLAVEWFEKERVLNPSTDPEYLTEAWSLLGNCYLYGRCGISKNPTNAIPWLQKAADADDRDALSDLGFCYLDGEGVEQNLTLAMQYMDKAAAKNKRDANFELGLIYENSREHIKQDLNRALKYFEAAGKCGHFDAAEAVKRVKQKIKKLLLPPKQKKTTEEKKQAHAERVIQAAKLKKDNQDAKSALDNAIKKQQDKKTNELIAKKNPDINAVINPERLYKRNLKIFLKSKSDLIPLLYDDDPEITENKINETKLCDIHTQKMAEKAMVLTPSIIQIEKQQHAEIQKAMRLSLINILKNSDIQNAFAKHHAHTSNKKLITAPFLQCKKYSSTHSMLTANSTSAENKITPKQLPENKKVPAAIQLPEKKDAKIPAANNTPTHSTATATNAPPSFEKKQEESLRSKIYKRLDQEIKKIKKTDCIPLILKEIYDIVIQCCTQESVTISDRIEMLIEINLFFADKYTFLKEFGLAIYCYEIILILTRSQASKANDQLNRYKQYYKLLASCYQKLTAEVETTLNNIEKKPDINKGFIKSLESQCSYKLSKERTFALSILCKAAFTRAKDDYEKNAFNTALNNFDEGLQYLKKINPSNMHYLYFIDWLSTIIIIGKSCSQFLQKKYGTAAFHTVEIKQIDMFLAYCQILSSNLINPRAQQCYATVEEFNQQSHHRLFNSGRGQRPVQPQPTYQTRPPYHPYKG